MASGQLRDGGSVMIVRYGQDRSRDTSFLHAVCKGRQVHSLAIDSREQPQNHKDSDEEPTCRICHLITGKADFITLGCACKQDMGRTHKECARKWFKSRGNRRCEICLQIAQNVPRNVVGKNQDTFLLLHEIIQTVGVFFSGVSADEMYPEMLWPL